MEKEIAAVLEELGSEGITAFYTYLVLGYLSDWIFLGLIVWGVRSVWLSIKDNI